MKRSEWIELDELFRAGITRWADVWAQHIAGIPELSDKQAEYQALASTAVGEPVDFHRSWSRYPWVNLIIRANPARGALVRDVRTLVRLALRCLEIETSLCLDHPIQTYADYVENESLIGAVVGEASFFPPSAYYSLYVISHPGSVVIVPDNRRDLLRALSREPELAYAVSPRRFEEIVAYVYELLGCRVEVTQESRDFGADILAWHPGPLDTYSLIAIQVKRYSGSRKVTLGDIFQLHGAVAHYHATQGHFVTTGDFTKPARSFAEPLKYNLVNLKRLHKEIVGLCQSSSLIGKTDAEPPLAPDGRLRRPRGEA